MPWKREFGPVPTRREHAMPPRATWGITRTSQEAEGVRDKCEQEPLLWFPWERESRVSRLRIG